MDKKFNGRKPGCKMCRNVIKETGIIMLIFGLVTICAFFLPAGAWIVILSVVFIICGIRLLKQR